MDDMNIDDLVKEGKVFFNKALDHLVHELGKVRAGKASVQMLDGIMVDYYGTPTPVNQVANLNTPDSKTISIQPWEKKMLGAIEKGIFEANLGITPQNDGEFIRITIPPMTGERRKELVKQTKSLGEEAKVGIRNGRHKLMDFIKKEVKDGYPEDAGKRKEADVEALVKDYYKKVDALLEAKEKDITTL